VSTDHLSAWFLTLSEQHVPAEHRLLPRCHLRKPVHIQNKFPAEVTRENCPLSEKLFFWTVLSLRPGGGWSKLQSRRAGTGTLEPHFFARNSRKTNVAQGLRSGFARTIFFRCIDGLLR
jgi:hypothetical protein